MTPERERIEREARECVERVEDKFHDLLANGTWIPDADFESADGKTYPYCEVCPQCHGGGIKRTHDDFDNCDCAEGFVLGERFDAARREEIAASLAALVRAEVEAASDAHVAFASELGADCRKLLGAIVVGGWNAHAAMHLLSDMERRCAAIRAKEGL